MKILGMLKLGFILAIFAVAACVMLAFVYSGTSAIIAGRQQADLDAGLKELFPDAGKFESIDNITSPDSTVTIESAYAALKDNEIIGAALVVSRGGFEGPIKIMVGAAKTGLITGVKILEHMETPGLGANAANPKYFVNRADGITFYGQFAGKSATDSFTVNNDIVCITASTITSVAIANSVKAAGLGISAWLHPNEMHAGN